MGYHDAEIRVEITSKETLFDPKKKKKKTKGKKKKRERKRETGLSVHTAFPKVTRFIGPWYMAL